MAIRNAADSREGVGGLALKEEHIDASQHMAKASKRKQAVKAEEPGMPWRLLLAFTLSGAAALGHQFLWMRLASIGIGSETIAVMATTVSFFFGMGIGSWFAPRLLARTGGVRAVSLFALMEIIAALFTLGSPWFVPSSALWLSVHFSNAVGQTAGSFSSAFVLLLFPCACLGATLPFLSAAVRPKRPASGEKKSRMPLLYAANTVGGMVATFGFVHIVFPALQLDGGAIAIGAIGLSAAALALSGTRGGSAHLPDDAKSRSAGILVRKMQRSLLLAMLISGFAGILLEVAATRVLGQVLKGTVYTFANVLTIYLGGMALGAWAANAMVSMRVVRRNTGTVNGILLLGIAIASVLSAWIMTAVPRMTTGLDFEAGATFQTQVLMELLAAAAVFALPTVLMGASTAMLLARAERLRFVGQSYGANMLGAAMAPVALTLALRSSAQFVDYQIVVAACPVLYAIAAMTMLTGWRKFERRGKFLRGGAALAVGALAFAVPSLGLVHPREGWRKVAYREGLYGVVLISENENVPADQRLSTRLLQVDSHYFMGGGIGYADGRIGALPVLISPVPCRRALLLGVGTGATVGGLVRAAGDDLEIADAVELVPEIVDFLPDFDVASGDIEKNPRVRIHSADARRFVAGTDDKYDVIVGDLFHPQRDGAAFLFSREHFAEVGKRLNANGVYAQWLPLFQLDPDSLSMIANTFLLSFPEGSGWKVGAWLSGSSGRQQALMLAAMAPGENREWRLPPSEKIAMLAVTAPNVLNPTTGAPMLLFPGGDLEVSALHWMDREGLQRLATGNRINTDRNPHLLFDAPKSNAKYSRSLAWKSLDSLISLQSVAGESDLQKLAWKQLLALQLQGDVAALQVETGDSTRAPVALEKYVEAFVAAQKEGVEFYPASDALEKTLTSDAQLAFALPRMARAAGARQPLLWKAWLDLLKRQGNRAEFESIATEARSILQPGP